jgi:hypothetical protein
MKTKTTNEEKTQALERKVSKTLLAGIARDWTAAEAAAKSAGEQTIIGVNRLRACGDKLKQLCGHEQITCEFYERVREQLPKTMRYTSARAAVHLANRLDKDVETVQEAAMVQRDMFAALRDFKEPKRLEAQTAHESNPWSEFVNDVSSLTSLFSRLEVDNMEAWDSERLGKFIDTTQPVADANAKAKAIRK